MSEQQPTVVALGEILWDVFPDGPRFGGAPANFAVHAAALGAKVQMLSGVGRDELGDRALAFLADRSLDVSLIQRPADFPTGQVQVAIDAAGFATYCFGEDEAWDHLVWSSDLAEAAAGADAVCFGTLGQRNNASREAIQRFIREAPSAVRIFDVNLRPPYIDLGVIEQSLQAATVLKLNDQELEKLSADFSVAGDDQQCLANFAKRFDLHAVALTRGRDGAALFLDGFYIEQAAVDTNVVDTVGAGDSFTAALVLGLLRRLEPTEMLRQAVEIAAFVCSQPGATPRLPAEFVPHTA